jgi:hypothetical protein
VARERGGNPKLGEFVGELGLPADFCSTSPLTSPLVDQVLLLRAAHPTRTFLSGILIAFVAMAEELLAQVGVESLREALEAFPPVTRTQTGKAVNTLTVEGPTGRVELRPLYNNAETVARHWLLRSRYPNSAPHATGQWAQHSREYELICSMSRRERVAVAEAMWAELLALEEFGGGEGEPRSVRPFEALLRSFPTAPREPGGAVMQGFAYAYYRADSPGITLITAKVGSGSSRKSTGVADVDGWDGSQLVLSVEVKDLAIDSSNLSEFDQFSLNLRRWPNATAVAFATSFSAEAVDFLMGQSILVFDRERMASNVSYWDLAKQRAAARALDHYFTVVQNHPALAQRFVAFCDAGGITY